MFIFPIKSDIYSFGVLILENSKAIGSNWYICVVEVIQTVHSIYFLNVSNSGYMSPEYAMEGSFSVKSDTYSFGVLLLEIVSGLKISSPHLIMNFPNLISYAWSLWRDGNAREFVDSSISESCSLQEVIRCIHLGLLCVQDHPNARPLMSSIVFMLENETTPLPTPKEPLYFTIRNYETDRSSEYIQRSLNKMSITTLEAR